MQRLKWTRSSLFVVLSVTAMGCMAGVSKQPLAQDPSLEAAEGSVMASRTANENTAVRVQVWHLAPPDRVTEGANTYVVWARPAGKDEATNLGALKVNQNLKGTLYTVTPYKDFEVFITAEAAPTASQPTGKQLLWASVRPKGY